jgi:hypothetical protein
VRPAGSVGVAHSEKRFIVRPMPPNPVLFYVNGEPWRLAGVSLVTGAAMFVVWLALLAVMVRKYGQTRTLSAEEAAQVAIHPNEPSYVDRTIALRGPARGAEAQVSYSIGTLRAAWNTRDYWKFFGLPAFMFLCHVAFSLFIYGVGAAMQDWVPLVASSVVLVPMFVINGFMMWAAIYTKLE